MSTTGHTRAPARPAPAPSPWRQPLSVWATAFAAVVAFMGIGLVDPILPSIAEGLAATPSQVSLLFTSYFLVTAVAMLITGAVSSRIGGKATLLLGLALVVVFAALSGTSDTVGALVGFRAGWGLGNALFIATALAVIVGAASGGMAAAIVLYEAALGVGIASGPLVGAVLGDWHWRAPFFGTAVLMAAGFLLIAVLLRAPARPDRPTRLGDPLRALAHGGLATTSATALFYNFAFFTVLAFTPFVLGMGAYGIGAVFFAWGVCVAVSSVVAAPRLQRRIGTVPLLHTALVLLLLAQAAIAVGIAAGATPAVIAAVVATGVPIGLCNTAFTEAAMEVSDAPRPVASAGYNFVRWIGGAAAPFVATTLGEALTTWAPYLLGAACCLVATAILAARRHHLGALARV
ncbi:MFS transporter [Streptomonospora sp. S1-112]|uniref:MFS transporter n=1 Tax=Streptomonospora mangrovi TaxID=2883123 RepID=A0A9X3NPH4_9ACTN|nr:MFS transporter [Streptomonospora mangrovi]MDA0565554.1 MFS transporter [Streptomonospora mangrovi]